MLAGRINLMMIGIPVLHSHCWYGFRIEAMSWWIRQRWMWRSCPRPFPSCSPQGGRPWFESLMQWASSRWQYQLNGKFPELMDAIFHLFCNNLIPTSKSKHARAIRDKISAPLFYEELKGQNSKISWKPTSESIFTNFSKITSQPRMQGQHGKVRH